MKELILLNTKEMPVSLKRFNVEDYGEQSFHVHDLKRKKRIEGIRVFLYETSENCKKMIDIMKNEGIDFLCISE